METIKIGEIAKIKPGIFCEDRGKGTVNYYQIRSYDIENNIFESDYKISLSKTVKNHLLNDKDLILTAKGSKYYCALYTNTKQKAVVSNAFFILRIFHPQICPEYIYWYLNRPEIRQKLQIQAKNYFIIKKEILKELSIPKIDLEKQIEIYTTYNKQNEALKRHAELLCESQSNLLKLLHTAPTVISK